MTKIFGILNVTPDSFSDGGVNFDFKNAIKTLETMALNNVYAVDIGAESTRPNASFVSGEEEIERLKTILPIAIKMGLTVSLDSRHAKTIEWGLNQGVKIVNDVTGFQDEKIIKLVKQFNVKAVFMHSLTVPANPDIVMKEAGFMQEIYNFGVNTISKFEQAGVKKEDLIFDPGIGFGKTGNQSIEIIKNIEFFKPLEVKILVGHSRKSFLKSAFANQNPITAEKDLMTTAFSAYLIAKKVDFLRLHNVEVVSCFL